MCCLCQKTSYLTHVFSMLYWALKKALILGLETRKKYENFRNFVRIHITKPHVFKCFTLFKTKEKLTQRFSKKITGIFDHLQAFPLSPLDTKMMQKHNRSVLYLMKNEQEIIQKSIKKIYILKVFHLLFQMYFLFFVQVLYFFRNLKFKKIRWVALLTCCR